MFHKRLTWVCDVIVLNACCLTVLLAWFVGRDWIWGLSLLNCIAVIALRHWLMKSLQIPWLTSILNRVLKRLVDMAVSVLFLLTVFPVIIVVQAIVIKSGKRSARALFSRADVRLNDEEHFSALVFSNYSPEGAGNIMGMTPLVLNLLVGTISLTDISSLSIRPMENETPEEIPEAETATDVLPEEPTTTDTNNNNIISNQTHYRHEHTEENVSQEV